MDFLTTNFKNEDIDVKFTGSFKLLDLPFEILLKIFIFLDVPDLQNVGMCCKILRIIANERFISRSRFFYVQQKIGLSLSLRPSVKDLNERNIIPLSRVPFRSNFSFNHFLLINSLQKSFKQENLSKQLNNRPSKDELKRINILPAKETSDLVREKLKEIQKAEISNMLDVLLKSYKFQNQQKSHNTSRIMKQKSIRDGTVEVCDDFTKAYMSFIAKMNKISTEPSSSSENKSLTKDLSLKEVLNHINTHQKFQTVEKQLKPDNTENSKDHISNVKLRRQYFENLENEMTSFNNTPRRSSGNVVPLVNPNKTNRKPSRTVLRASVIDDSTISYEKMF